MELWPELRNRARSLREHGVPVLFLATEEFASVYEECADEVVICPDVFSEDAVVEALTPFQGRLDRFSIINDKIWPVQLGAARRLGMDFPGFQGQLNCRIKPRLREVLAEQLPLHTEVFAAADLTPENVAAAVERLGTPFVIKPIWGTASAFVDIVKDPARAYDELAETFESLRADHPHGPFDDGTRVWDPRNEVLLESFIGAGRELSFEAFVQNGDLVPLLIQEKLLWAEQDGFRLETANVCPTPFVSAEEEARIRDILEEALRELGVDDTFVHIELKWDGENVSIIEINPRIGGGSVAKTLIAWLDADVREMGRKLQRGEPLPRKYARVKEGFLLGVFVNAVESGIFKEFTGLDWVHAQPEFDFEQSYLQAGQRVPGRGESKATREGWMYTYDAFFHVTDEARIDELHDETRKRVLLTFETP
uniref:Carbamoylphosphate synthetase large subunit n=1 Tax=Streptomyces sp. K01-0509 TaxID=1238679 RepID=K4JV76_9ACTN|nr:Carbamoylphosphate synthetase large subunit [Streptomyces sp. K01-0509]